MKISTPMRFLEICLFIGFAWLSEIGRSASNFELNFDDIESFGEEGSPAKKARVELEEESYGFNSPSSAASAHDHNIEYLQEYGRQLISQLSVYREMLAKGAFDSVEHFQIRFQYFSVFEELMKIAAELAKMRAEKPLLEVFFNSKLVVDKDKGRGSSEFLAWLKEFEGW